ncbi:MAG: hypothetical protein AAGI03_01480 [Pseudomonadota bacterium]
MSGTNRTRNRDQLIPKVNIEGLARHLRRLHPVNTATMVSARTSIPEKTVRNWLNQSNELRAVHLFVLVGAYEDPSIFSAAWPSEWMDVPRFLVEAEYVAERDRLQSELDRLEHSRLASLADQGAR